MCLWFIYLIELGVLKISCSSSSFGNKSHLTCDRHTPLGPGPEFRKLECHWGLSPQLAWGVGANASCRRLGECWSDLLDSLLIPVENQLLPRGGHRTAFMSVHYVMFNFARCSSEEEVVTKGWGNCRFQQPRNCCFPPSNLEPSLICSETDTQETLKRKNVKTPYIVFLGKEAQAKYLVLMPSHLSNAGRAWSFCFKAQHWSQAHWL